MADATQLAEALRGLLNAVDCYGMPFNHADRNLARQALAAVEAQASTAAEPVAWVSLTANGQIAYFDGKPMVMPGPVGNDCHPTPLYAAPVAQAEPAWRSIETAPDDTPVVVAWFESDRTPHHDFDIKEDGCWMRWHDHAEHVEIIGGHGISYTPPYSHWMPLPQPPKEGT